MSYIYHDPVAWVADPGLILHKDKILPLGVFEEACIFPGSSFGFIPYCRGTVVTT